MGMEMEMEMEVGMEMEMATRSTEIKLMPQTVQDGSGPERHNLIVMNNVVVQSHYIVLLVLSLVTKTATISPLALFFFSSNVKVARGKYNFNVWSFVQSHV